ncbi:MAG: hypothetical protein HY922_14985 [Elusimicrobia bacterium]|nr:hypothetical protein [Elusimicrobiota bacterium]
MKSALSLLMSILLLANGFPLAAFAGGGADPGSKKFGAPHSWGAWRLVSVNGQSYYCYGPECNPAPAKLDTIDRAKNWVREKLGKKAPPPLDFQAPLYRLGDSRPGGAPGAVVKDSYDTQYMLMRMGGTLYAVDRTSSKQYPARFEASYVPGTGSLTVRSPEETAADVKKKTDAAAKEKARKDAAARKKAKDEAAARKKAKEDAAAKKKAEQEAIAKKKADDDAAAKQRAEEKAKEDAAKQNDPLRKAIAKAFPNLSGAGLDAANCVISFSDLKDSFLDTGKLKNINLDDARKNISRLTGLHLEGKDLADEKNAKLPNAERMKQCFSRIKTQDGLLAFYCDNAPAAPEKKAEETVKAPAEKGLAQRCVDLRFAKAFPDELERAVMECVVPAGELAAAKQDSSRINGMITKWRPQAVLKAQFAILGSTDVPKANKQTLSDPEKQCLLGAKLGMDKLKKYYCQYEPKNMMLKAGATRAMPQLGIAASQQDEGGDRKISFDEKERPGKGAVTPVPAEGGASQFQELQKFCSDQGKTAEQNRKIDEKGFTAVDIKGPDRDMKKAEEDEKKSELMKNLKKDAIGGAFGAAGFGILGFIFGGPVGALIGGMIGFGLMAAVTHLNNNPIK